MRRLAALACVLAAAGAGAQLSLSDLTIPSGQTVVMQFVGMTGTPGSQGSWVRVMWNPSGGIGTLVEGSAQIAGTGDAQGSLTFSLLRCMTNSRCQWRHLGTDTSTGFAAYFEPVAPATEALYDDGTFYWLDDRPGATQLSFPAADLPNNDVGSGFLNFDETGTIDAVAARMWNMTDGNHFVFAFTRPAPPDNCDIYLGAVDLEAPGELRLGALTPARVYLGASLVCGDAP